MNNSVEILQETLYLEKTINNLLLKNTVYNEGFEEIKNAIVKFIKNFIEFLRDKIRAFFNFIRKLFGLKEKTKEKPKNIDDQVEVSNMSEEEFDKRASGESKRAREHVKYTIPKDPTWLRSINRIYLSKHYIEMCSETYKGRADAKYFSPALINVKKIIDSVMNDTKQVEKEDVYSEAEVFRKYLTEFNDSLKKAEKEAQRLLKYYENSNNKFSKLSQETINDKINNTRMALMFLMQVSQSVSKGVNHCISLYNKAA